MTATQSGPTIRIGSRELPVAGPRLSDPRLHLASVIITIHVLGQTALDFRVSVVHIVASIGICFLIEATRTLLLEQRLVWPASAMLTGSGVALILRLPDTEANQPWATDGWHIFVAVAALSLASKYLIRFRGDHVFNPSNLVLVLTFVALGSDRVEPLDFWWVPFGIEMGVAYAVILIGGITIVRRLGLLPMAAAFWVTLAVGLGAVAIAGHCMTALWSLHPVCDGHFWWIVLTSPETLIFLFFMITDPRTVPSSPRGRVLFGVAVACTSTLLMVPQSTEFGTKVGLLGGLAICSAVRPLVRVAASSAGAPGLPLLSGLARPTGARSGTNLVLPVAAATVLVLAAVTLESGARRNDELAPAQQNALIDPTGARPPVDPTSLPTVEVDPEALTFAPTMAGSGAQDLAATFVWLLQVESDALARGDLALLRAVTQGPRRDDALDRFTTDANPDTPSISYGFDHLRLVLVRRGQGTVRLGFEAIGTTRTTTLDDDGVTLESTVSPVEQLFVLFGPSMGRWFLFDTLALEPSDN